MENQLFLDIYNDTIFKRKAEAMLKTIYRQNKIAFDDDATDLDDFVQEMWCELFEEKRFTPDRPWCFEAMRHNAINYIRDIQNRLRISENVVYDEEQLAYNE